MSNNAANLDNLSKAGPKQAIIADNASAGEAGAASAYWDGTGGETGEEGYRSSTSGGDGTGGFNTAPTGGTNNDPNNFKKAGKGSREILRDDDPNWLRAPYQVTFGDSFATMADALAYAMHTWGSYNKSTSPQADGQLGRANAQTSHEIGMDVSGMIGAPDFINHPFFKDTRVGANDAINCTWQFNRDDDIVHPMMHSEAADIDIGMGRVYAQTIDRNQSIAYFSFGVPRYTPLADFYANAFDKDLIQYNNTGIGASGNYSIARLLGQGFTCLFAMPLVACNFIFKIANQLTDLPVSRLYDLRLTMPAYYAYVDYILTEWLVDTGLYGNGPSDPKFSAPKLSTEMRASDLLNIDEPTYTGNIQGDQADAGSSDGSATGDNNSREYTPQALDVSGARTRWDTMSANPAVVPAALRATGLSIWDILVRKCQVLGFEDLGRNSNYLYDQIDQMRKITQGGNKSAKEIETSYFSQFKKWSGWFGGMANVIEDTALGATQFVGFKIDKDTDASESLSNSTKPNPIAEKINSAVNAAADKMKAASNGETGFKTLDTAIEGVGNFLRGAADALNMGGTMEATVAGAFIDAPDIYANTDFNKSHSLKFQLRAPYGTLTSIYQSIMVPLAMLMAGCFPRAAGPNSYMSPFLCRVYCKGLFSIPLGLIESISISRGSPEFGWTYQNLPTCVDVSITVKDLSPAMYMSVKGTLGDKIKNLWTPPNSFNEYLLTLAGTGLFERISLVSQMRRKIQFTAHELRHTYTNSNYWGMQIGDLSVSRVIANLHTQNMLPTQ